MKPGTKEWHDARRLGIGGSDAIKIMAGEWNELWQVKTGRKDPDSLDDVLAVQLGSFTEPFNIGWFQRQTGLFVSKDSNDFLKSTTYPFMLCNLDGRVGEALFEAKHVGQQYSIEQIIERYYAQLQHNLYVCNRKEIYISVIFGNKKWEMALIPADSAYQGQLIEAETEFWRHVEAGIEPSDRKAAAAVEIDLDSMIEVDFTGNNAFAEAAASWVSTIDARKKNQDSEKTLKELMPENARLSSGYGVKIVRDRANRLSVKKM